MSVLGFPLVGPKAFSNVRRFCSLLISSCKALGGQFMCWSFPTTWHEACRWQWQNCYTHTGKHTHTRTHIHILTHIHLCNLMTCSSKSLSLSLSLSLFLFKKKLWRVLISAGVYILHSFFTLLILSVHFISHSVCVYVCARAYSRKSIVKTLTIFRSPNGYILNVLVSLLISCFSSLLEPREISTT